MKYILEHIYEFPGNVKNIFKLEIHSELKSVPRYWMECKDGNAYY